MKNIIANLKARGLKVKEVGGKVQVAANEEGSRVTAAKASSIGKTQSGKPVHHHSMNSHRRFNKQDHHDAANVHMEKGEKALRNRDLKTSRHHMKQATYHMDMVDKTSSEGVPFSKASVTAAASKPPSIKTMEKWMDTGIAKATDGCKVEPDGYCSHGKPSWLLVLGLI